MWLLVGMLAARVKRSLTESHTRLPRVSDIGDPDVEAVLREIHNISLRHRSIKERTPEGLIGDEDQVR